MLQLRYADECRRVVHCRGRSRAEGKRQRTKSAFWLRQPLKYSRRVLFDYSRAYVSSSVRSFVRSFSKRVCRHTHTYHAVRYSNSKRPWCMVCLLRLLDTARLLATTLTLYSNSCAHTMVDPIVPTPLSASIMRFYPGESQAEDDIDTNCGSSGPTSTSHRRTPSIVQFFPGSHLLDYTEREGEEQHQQHQQPLTVERDERDPSFPKLLRKTTMLYPAYKFLSLWLLPPPLVRETLFQRISQLSHEYNGSVPFVPHVTVIGSIPCESRQHGQQLGKLLQQGLAGTGGIPCIFRDEIVSMYNPDSTLIWSQACLSVMQRSVEFLELLERSRSIVGMNNGMEWMFPGPAREPHLSHYYGSERPPPPDTVIPPPDFIAQEVALFITSPGTLVGVKSWKQLTIIQLC